MEIKKKRKMSIFKKFKILFLISTILILGAAGFAFYKGYLFLYTVEPNELAVERLFGKYFRVTQPGLHFTLPYPIVKKNIIDAKIVKRVEIGYHTQADGVTIIKNEAEANMLTGDENIIVLEVAVQYQIVDPTKYLFSVANSDEFIINSSKTALRNVIGKHSIDDALTNGKLTIEKEISIQIKELWKKYDLGLSLLSVQLQEVNPPKEVIGAFKDVASAREDKNTYINQSIAYKEKTIPLAKANAFKIIQEAKAYKLTRDNKAKAEVKRFEAIYDNYKENKNIVKKKLYLETMQKVLSDVKLYVTDSKSGNLNLLNLNGDK